MRMLKNILPIIIFCFGGVTHGQTKFVSSKNDRVFLDSIPVGASYRLKFYSGSCYQNYNIDIRLWVEKTGVYASASNRYWYAYDKKNHILPRRRVSAAVLDTLRQLEAELIAIKNEADSLGWRITPHDCRELKLYTFYNKGKKKEYDVIDCRAGTYQRITKLFGLKDD